MAVISQELLRPEAPQLFLNAKGRVPCESSGDDLDRFEISPRPGPEVNLAGCDLTLAILTGSILLGTNFSNAKLLGADLSSAQLTDVDFTGANLDGTNFDGSDFTGATFAGCTGTPVGTPSFGTLPTCG
ncbi:MAG: pentapeptide repeat-containing protein [Nitrososphaera sp.]